MLQTPHTVRKAAAAADAAAAAAALQSGFEAISVHGHIWEESEGTVQ